MDNYPIVVRFCLECKIDFLFTILIYNLEKKIYTAEVIG